MSRRHPLRLSVVDFMMVVLFCGLFAAIIRSHGATALAILLLIWVARVAWSRHRMTRKATSSCVECGRPFPPSGLESGENLWRVAGQVVWNLASVVLTIGAFALVLLENFSWALNTPPGKPFSLFADFLGFSIMATMLGFFALRLRSWWLNSQSDVPLQASEIGPALSDARKLCVGCRLARLGEEKERHIRIEQSKRLLVEAFFGVLVAALILAAPVVWALARWRRWFRSFTGLISSEPVKDGPAFTDSETDLARAIAAGGRGRASS